MLRSLATLLLVTLAVVIPVHVHAATGLLPPVDAAISEAFVPPETEYGAGHRGIDYAVPVGTPVRATTNGRVVFSGTVAGVLAVTVEHDSGIESTYTGLSRVDVRVGEVIEEGRFIGASGTMHGAPGLHFGIKVDEVYVDPTTMLASLDVAGAIHLAPLHWMPDELGALGASLTPPSTVGDAARRCRALEPLHRPARPPNDNIVVAVAGITSKTEGGISADIYEHGPELLGYPAADTYHFSYAGHDGRRLHEPYSRQDTYIDIRTAASRLRSLMRRIAQRHPGRDVDLIAHSQGGIVARTFLTTRTKLGGRLPRVEHLVTYASPHRGAPGASQVAPLRNDTVSGRYLLGAAKEMADAGLPVPDPGSAAVRQLAPGSELMDALAREDTAYGTRVLTLAIPNDPVVPADHAGIPGKQGRMVPWTGTNLGGHSEIVTSPVAHGIAYSFLSDRAPTCTTTWDAVAPRVGAIWSALESSASRMYTAVERALAGTTGPVGVLMYEASR